MDLTTPRHPPATPRHRKVLLAGGGLGLLLGTYTGLARAGVGPARLAADIHSVVMVLGFLGTLIALERAVALGRRWGYLAPVLNTAAVLALPVTRELAGVLFVLAGGVVTATYLVLLRAGGMHAHMVVMTGGALAWIAAAAWWLSGSGPVRATPVLAAFLVLTIIGERLELSRLTLPGAGSRRRFLAVLGLFATGVAATPVDRGTGLVVGGVALLGMVAWLLRYDVARRTVRRPGLPRFSAVCMLTGYGWMTVSGLLWVAIGLGASGPLLHDAMVHSLFLGFVLSMVMGHAPIIVPAVLRRPLQFHPVAYGPLVLLHLSVALRIGADLGASYPLREVALHGNVAALVLFVGVTIWATRRPTPAPFSPHTAVKVSP
ncbi:MAG TPA: hypothetical protein VK906_12410 [Egicoccus sp.]|nr:hypothetical protein [Egicoccus sp.]HSK23977.1 hypothetical protein [Egicoccus sp.]